MDNVTIDNITIAELSLRAVVAERKRQDAKWGVQNHDPFFWLTIIGEEYGETCKAALELSFKNGGRCDSNTYIEALTQLRTEAVQTAASALAMVECLDRNEWLWRKS